MAGTQARTKKGLKRVYASKVECWSIQNFQCDISLAAFGKFVKNFVVHARFMSSNHLYFDGEIREDLKQILLKPEYRLCRTMFAPEVRDSRLLILSIKGKSSLTLREATEIFFMSSLVELVTHIELIAVNPKKLRPLRDNTSAKDDVIHAYVQFETTEQAASAVNKVDGMPYKGKFVHSPQCDEHEVFFPNAHFGFDTHIYKNPSYVPLRETPFCRSTISSRDLLEVTPSPMIDCGNVESEIIFKLPEVYSYELSSLKCKSEIANAWQ